ncbi:MAG: 2-oxoacid:acceptor oxidoreductase family protein [Candidatus Omnitrophica bacterium]|nr:2-oxoacid:acceptor oxidoreductase family protein [Candidatus Omnitrophota bacterium]
MTNITTILFYGIGGQGVLTAAEICARAALLEQQDVKKTEIHGMAQRGGSVESFVRFGSSVYSPLPVDGKADVLVCLHAEEHARFSSKLNDGGKDISPFLTRADAAVGENKKFINSYMLGVLAAQLTFLPSTWETAMEQVFKRNIEENKTFFRQGFIEGKRA